MRARAKELVRCAKILLVSISVGLACAVDASAHAPPPDTASSLCWNFVCPSRKLGNGNAETVRDAEGRMTTQVFDGRDRLTQRILPEGWIETQAFDDADNRIETTLNTVPSQVQAFGFDARNREVTRTDANGKLWTTSFDGVGNVLQRVDPLGNAISFVYVPCPKCPHTSPPHPRAVFVRKLAHIGTERPDSWPDPHTIRRRDAVRAPSNCHFPS